MQINNHDGRFDVYIIAGELSGDAIGSKLMLQIQNKLQGVNFYGVGGPAMESQGFMSLFKYDQINLVGFVEIVPHILRLRSLIKQTAEDIIAKNPDILVTIDSPGFSYRVAKIVRKICPNMKMIHIVAPSVWAYKPGRAAKFAAIYNHMLTLLPFEPKYFEDVGMPATCIGHPIFDQEFNKDNAFRARYKIDEKTKLIVMTPGSRRSEVARHLPLFMQVMQNLKSHYNDLVIVIPTNLTDELQSFFKNSQLYHDGRVILVNHSERLSAYAAADVALAKSGTNTLEIAASKTPMIVVYKMNFLTFWSIRMMAKIKFASLINIMANKEIVPEFLQHKATSENLTAELFKIIDNPEVGKNQVKESVKSLKAMGLGSNMNPTKLAAEVIVKCL